MQFFEHRKDHLVILTGREDISRVELTGQGNALGGVIGQGEDDFSVGEILLEGDEVSQCCGTVWYEIGRKEVPWWYLEPFMKTLQIRKQFYIDGGQLCADGIEQGLAMLLLWLSCKIN